MDDNTIEPDEITYAPILDFPRGTFFHLVRASYAPIADERLCERWRNADQDVYDHPETVAPCVVVTCLRGEPIGLTSYDPRAFPRASIGQNCVLPDHRGKGYGRRQLLRLLDVLKAKGFQDVVVTTADEPFFKPAKAMYEACGFVEAGRRRDGNRGLIDYEMQFRPVRRNEG